MSAHPGASIVTDQLPVPTADQIAQPRRRVMLPVSFGQWDRLKGRISMLGNARLDYVNYVAGAWGICIPSAVSFFIYWNDDPRPKVTLVAYGFAAVGSAAVAMILRRFQRDEAMIRQQDAADIVGEMSSIEEAYLRGETAS